ncbi:DUF2878 domain-containing protein [Neptuniibacter sp. QD29_5]|uniref:DUF2878 domain-containing protein n=1 Tax=Neptuniibacter sp. QD29_5 TaxID=3398207 RepID=UPI0039F5EA67
MSERFWVNAIGFQLVWWLSILYGNDAVIVVSFIICLHLIFHSDPVLETCIVFSLAALGFVVDSVLTLYGVFEFDNSSFPPFWLLLLWMGFVATLRHSLAFFNNRLLLSALVGAIGGSSTYIAAAKLGAVSLGFSMLSSFLILAAIWLLLFPFLMYFSHRLGARYVRSDA